MHKAYEIISIKIIIIWYNSNYDLFFSRLLYGKWVFIRFNPDGKGVDMVDKLDRLMQEIQIQIDRIENDENNELLEIIKLYY